MIPRETLHELAYLRRRVDELEAEIESLRTQRNDAAQSVRKALDLTIGQCRLLVALAEGGIQNREKLLTLCCDNERGEERLVDSLVKRIRQRRPDLKITTHYGFGYELEGESLVRVRAIIRSAQ